MQLSNFFLFIPVVLAGCAGEPYRMEDTDPAADMEMQLPASPGVDSEIRQQQLQERGVSYGEIYKDAEENAPNLGPNAPGYVPPLPD